jgi:hypothetical protein
MGRDHELIDLLRTVMEKLHSVDGELDELNVNIEVTNYRLQTVIEKASAVLAKETSKSQIIPREQLTWTQRENLEKLNKSRKAFETDIAEVLQRHGVPKGAVIELRCGFPPSGDRYCKDADGAWYCCDAVVGGDSG